MGWLDKIASKITNELGPNALSQDERAELELATALIATGRLDEAQRRLAPLLSVYPRAAAVLVAAGELAHAQHDLEGAVSLFGRAADNAPTDGAAWLRLAEVLLQLGRYEPARDAARKSLDLFDAGPGDGLVRGRATVVLGKEALARGRFDDARRAFEQARVCGVPDNEIAEDLGRALLLAQERQEAAKWFLLAAQNPKASPALVLEAAALQPSPRVANGFLDAVLARVKTDDTERQQAVLPLRARLARGYAHEDKDLARGQLAFFAPAPTADLGADAAADLAQAYGALESFVEASAYSCYAESLSHLMDVEAQLTWALGTKDLSTLQELGARVAERAPALTSRISAAFGANVDHAAFTAILASAPPDTVDAWAAHTAPAPIADANAAMLLQRFMNVMKPLATSHELAWSAGRALANIGRPFSVALLGEFNAGKSSLVNCLVGADLAPVGVKPTTATVNTFRHGMGGVNVVYRSAAGRKARTLSTAQLQPFLCTISDEDAAQIDTVEIMLPEPHLVRFEWVDTPGLNAPREAHELITKRFMGSADVVIWVMSAPQAAKASELAVLHELAVAHTPVLAVLNKIDQVEPNDVPTIHAMVKDSFPFLGIVDASLKQSVAAQACRDLVLRHLDAFCLPRAEQLKQRSALAALRPLITAARKLVQDAAPLEGPLNADRARWDPVAAKIEQNSLSAGQLYIESLRRVTVAALDELGKMVHAPEHEVVLRVVLAHTEAANQAALLHLRGLPDDLVSIAAGLCERYGAQVRGRLEGGLAEQLGSHHGKRDAQRRVLEQAFPDPQRWLWQPWRDKAEAFAKAQASRLQRNGALLNAEQAVHEARFAKPLAALDTMVQAAWRAVVAQLHEAA